MNANLTTIMLAVALVGSLTAADQRSAKTTSDPGLSALEKQNAILEERIKLLTQQQEPDPLVVQTEALAQRIKLMNQEQTLQSLATRNIPRRVEADRKEDAIESTRLAFTALAGIAPEVAKAFGCEGKNIVLYGETQSDALLSVTTFRSQLDLLRARLKSVLDLHAPAMPGQQNPGSGVFGVSSLSAAVLQSVLDLISFFHGGEAAGPASIPVDDAGLVALVAKAATSQGCQVYWPDQYSANPYNPHSQVMASLQSLAELNDNGGDAAKPVGLQLRLQALRIELKRSESMSLASSQKIEVEQSKITQGANKVDALRAQIDFLSGHISDQKNAVLQDKLNKTFEKSWEELEAAVKKQLKSDLPGTIEEQGRLGEMSKRLDVLKTRTDWLSQYVKDEKDATIQDKLKRELSGYWDQLDVAVKAQQTLNASLPQAIETDVQEKRRWDKYSSELRELIGTTSAASEAYTTFRGALLDSNSGTSALNRMLKAEALRDLTFDDKLQERSGASIVQLRLQRLTGSKITKAGFKETESFSGGVVLSFIQYEPSGKVKNSGVYTAYSGFKP